MPKRIGANPNIVVQASRRTPTSNSVPVPVGIHFYRRIIHFDGRIEFIPIRSIDAIDSVEDAAAADAMLEAEYEAVLRGEIK